MEDCYNGYSISTDKLLINWSINDNIYYDVKKIMIDHLGSEQDGEIAFGMSDEFRIRSKYKILCKDINDCSADIVFFFDDKTKTFSSIIDLNYFIKLDVRGYEKNSVNELYDEEVGKVKKFFLMNFPHLNYKQDFQIISDNYWNIKLFEDQSSVMLKEKVIK